MFGNLKFCNSWKKLAAVQKWRTHLMKSISLNQKILTKKMKGVSLFTPNLLMQYYADAMTAANRLAQAQPAGNFKIKLPAQKPSSKPGTAAQQVAVAKPSHQRCASGDAPVNPKKC